MIMSKKDDKKKTEDALPPMSPSLQIKKEEAIEKLSKIHNVSKIVAECIFDAKLKALHEAHKLKEKKENIRELLDDCYPIDLDD